MNPLNSSNINIQSNEITHKEGASKGEIIFTHIYHLKVGEKTQEIKTNLRFKNCQNINIEEFKKKLLPTICKTVEAAIAYGLGDTAKNVNTNFTQKTLTRKPLKKSKKIKNEVKHFKDFDQTVKEKINKIQKSIESSAKDSEKTQKYQKRLTYIEKFQATIPPQIEDPKPETPKPETPKPETPKPETPKPDTQGPEAPKPKATSWLAAPKWLKIPSLSWGSPVSLEKVQEELKTSMKRLVEQEAQYFNKDFKLTGGGRGYTPIKNQLDSELNKIINNKKNRSIKEDLIQTKDQLIKKEAPKLFSQKVFFNLLSENKEISTKYPYYKDFTKSNECKTILDKLKSSLNKQFSGYELNEKNLKAALANPWRDYKKSISQEENTPPDIEPEKISVTDIQVEEIESKGLKNLGNTCYLNSTLQTLFHIPLFRELIENSEENDNLINALKTLFNIYSGKLESENLEQGLNIFLKELQTAVDNDQIISIGHDVHIQQDAAGLIRELLGKLKFEVKTLDTRYYVNDKKLFKEPTVHSAHILPLLVNLQDESGNLPKTFQGLIHVNTDKEIALREAKLQNSGTASITKINEAPQHLVIQANRFYYVDDLQFKQDIPFDFNDQETVDLSEMIADDVKKPGETFIYKPVAVIEHKGLSVASGHYVAHIKKEDGWKTHNDSEIYPTEKKNLSKGYIYVLQRVNAS